MLKIYLKKGREKPVRNGHPWIFSGAVQRVEGGGESGASCMVIDAQGAVLGHGFYNAKSSITVRMLTKGDEPFSRQLLRERLSRAIGARASILSPPDTDSCRIVNAEGDFLPGLIVDRYAGGLCLQILAAGMERMRDDIVSLLDELCAPAFLFERSESEARQREGLDPRAGLLAGSLRPDLVIKENGCSMAVDIAGGQKTGFFLDQRNNRRLIRDYAQRRRCLDCFSYSGGFALNALAAGASGATAVDISKEAVVRARANFAFNGFSAKIARAEVADVFDFLRSSSGTFDLIVLDPPKFAKHPAEVPRAARGYKDINMVAMKAIAAGGVIFTFSCSNAVDQRLFRQIVFAAAADSARNVQLLHVLSAGPDHPVNIAHPEGEYLKGLVVRVE